MDYETVKRYHIIDYGFILIVFILCFYAYKGVQDGYACYNAFGSMRTINYTIPPKYNFECVLASRHYINRPLEWYWCSFNQSKLNTLPICSNIIAPDPSSLSSKGYLGNSGFNYSGKLP